MSEQFNQNGPKPNGQNAQPQNPNSVAQGQPQPQGGAQAQPQPQTQAQPRAYAQGQAQPRPAGSAAAQGQARPQAAGQGPINQPQPPYPWPPVQGADPSFYAAQGYAPYAPQPPQAPKAPRKQRSWIVPLIMVIIICLALVISVVSCSSSVMYFASKTDSTVVETQYPTVAVITIDSTIQYDNTACSPEGFKVLLDEAAADSNIRAVVLRVNSGGGTATAGEEMATYLAEFKQNTGKPVVVSSASTNASAAYEISSQADYIYVSKSTAIGAIGTAMQVTDYSGLLEMLGINIDNIVSSDSKDSTYGTRALTDEERAYYQHQVDQITEVFIQTVADGRHMTKDQVKALANGLTYTGIDAVDNGLADKIGTLEDAMDKAADLAGVGDYHSYELYLSSGSDLSSVISTLLGSQTHTTGQSTDDVLKEYSNVSAVQ